MGDLQALTPQRTGFQAGDGPVMDGVSHRIHTHPRYLLNNTKHIVYILTERGVE
jgi:hypothetical protein